MSSDRIIVDRKVTAPDKDKFIDGSSEGMAQILLMQSTGVSIPADRRADLCG